MQERIIGRLKDTALGTDKPAPGWTREQARRWVGIILRRYGALNVRTIDSLLHLIVRLTALELDLPPDFEPVFATDEAIAPLLDSLLEQSRSDERLHALLEEACRNVFFHSPQRGLRRGKPAWTGLWPCGSRRVGNHQGKTRADGSMTAFYFSSPISR